MARSPHAHRGTFADDIWEALRRGTIAGLRRDFPAQSCEVARDAAADSVHLLLEHAPPAVRADADQAARWLRVVARRRMLRELRREARLVSLDVADRAAATDLSAIEAALTLEALLALLDPVDSAALRLYATGVPVACIAAILGTTRKSVYRILRRAKLHLRRAIDWEES